MNCNHIVYRIVMALMLLSGFFYMAPVQSADPGSGGLKTISGNIWYRERMMLPPNAEIDVILEDASRMDVAATVIAETSFKAEGAPPYAYSLQYDPAKIQPNMRYGMRVRIEANGQLMFINTEHIPAFAQDSGEPVDVMVSRIGLQQGSKGSHPPKPDASLINTYWKPVELRGRPVTTGAGQRELHMVLTGRNNRVRGFSGCNRFLGHYAVSNDQLYFNQLASTQMMCFEAMEQEQQFLEALGSATRFEIKGDVLMLYTTDGPEILRFEAVYLY
jgi:putative lipoprotein